MSPLRYDVTQKTTVKLIFSIFPVPLVLQVFLRFVLFKVKMQKLSFSFTFENVLFVQSEFVTEIPTMFSFAKLS